MIKEENKEDSGSGGENDLMRRSRSNSVSNYSLSNNSNVLMSMGDEESFGSCFNDAVIMELSPE